MSINFKNFKNQKTQRQSSEIHHPDASSVLIPLQQTTLTLDDFFLPSDSQVSANHPISVNQLLKFESHLTTELSKFPDYLRTGIPDNISGKSLQITPYIDDYQYDLPSKDVLVQTNEYFGDALLTKTRAMCDDGKSILSKSIDEDLLYDLAYRAKQKRAFLEQTQLQFDAANRRPTRSALALDATIFSHDDPAYIAQYPNNENIFFLSKGIVKSAGDTSIQKATKFPVNVIKHQLSWSSFGSVEIDNDPIAAGLYGVVHAAKASITDCTQQGMFSKDKIFTLLFYFDFILTDLYGFVVERIIANGCKISNHVECL
jgi:hypothetical protein